MAAAGSEVRFQGLAVGQVLESSDVSFGEVGDVDVVADARAVGRRVVVAVDVEGGALAVDGFESRGDEVGFGIVDLADFTAFVGAGGVEITEADEAQPVGWFVGFEGAFEHQLGNAVGIHRQAWHFLGDGH